MRISFGLSRELWLIEAGVFLNMLGYGGVLPFEIIYLHNGRGFSLGVAGLVVGTITGIAVVVSPAAGQLIDRFGARLTSIAAGVALAAGYGGLAFARTPAEAFAAAACAGAGNGILSPSQSTLLTTLAAADIRHRVTAVSRVAGNAGIGIGGALGGLVAARGLSGFVALFLANAVSYLVYVAVLAAVVHESPRRPPVRGGYRVLLRDRAFLHLAVADVAMIAVGWGVFSWLVPPFARNQLGLSTSLIGLLLLVNALAVVVAQVPVARLAEGRRRALTMALAGALFCGACLLVEVADASRSIAYAVLMVAVVAAGVGECLHTTALTPLVAELAPARLRGRYMAVAGLCFWIGLSAAPTGGAALLSVSPTAVFGVAAGVALAAAVSMLRLERRLPEAARLTPRPLAGPRQEAGRGGDQDRQGGRDEQRVAQADAGGGRADRDRAAEQPAVGDRRDPADVASRAGGVQPHRGGDDLREDPGLARAEQGEPGDGRGRGGDQQPGGQAQAGDQAADPD